jgi:hypothetical protein
MARTALWFNRNPREIFVLWICLHLWLT